MVIQLKGLVVKTVQNIQMTRFRSLEYIKASHLILSIISTNWSLLFRCFKMSNDFFMPAMWVFALRLPLAKCILLNSRVNNKFPYINETNWNVFKHGSTQDNSILNLLVRVRWNMHFIFALILSRFSDWMQFIFCGCRM